ncbi:phosphoglucomutase [Clostridiales Family XIII bacterium PM5-7]
MNMNYDELETYVTTEYKRWEMATKNDAEFNAQLQALAGENEELIDAFYCDLHFGTSGIRGVLGPGTNRMNEYVVKRTTLGLANYINKAYSAAKVVIAYDTRKKSKVFAEETAKALSSKGIEAYLFPDIAPVSLLSYAIIALECTMGIMITASHNPKIFNGYKVYNQHGYQIVGEEARQISKEIERLDYFDEVIEDNQRIHPVEEWVSAGFVDDIVKLSTKTNPQALKEISIVYTPLNGTGNHYVREVLSKIGCTNVNVVESQEQPNEEFTTCPVPNPEKISVYAEAFKLLDQVKGDVIIATDPDCDRVGVALYHQGVKTLLTGNQVGILLFDYLCTVKKPNPGQMMIRSIVSTPLVDKIAKAIGLNVVTTLTGFKYIGEIITELDKNGELDQYYFGFEESNGYLIDGFVRDKDGVSTAMITAEMAAYHHANGKDLITRLKEIYRSFGNCFDKTNNFYFEGPSGRDAMKQIMEHFRSNVITTIGKLQITKRIDYLEPTHLPKEDVLQYELEDGSVFIIRPSGTEAKIKVYLFETQKSSTLDLEIKRIIQEFKEE